MQRRKFLAGGDDLEYEYVIVDEAARVSPRDLMIPMAQGKKIILVVTTASSRTSSTKKSPSAWKKARTARARATG